MESVGLPAKTDSFFLFRSLLRPWGLCLIPRCRGAIYCLSKSRVKWLFQGGDILFITCTRVDLRGGIGGKYSAKKAINLTKLVGVVTHIFILGRV